jgi:hypothetical protein
LKSGKQSQGEYYRIQWDRAKILHRRTETSETSKRRSSSKQEKG